MLTTQTSPVRAIMNTSRLLVLAFLLTTPAMVTLAQPRAASSIKPQTTLPVVDTPKGNTDSLQAYTGTYEVAPDQRLHISLSDGKLYILPPGETAKTELKPVDESRFNVVGETAYLIFLKDGAGQFSRVDLHFGNGASATAKKM